MSAEAVAALRAGRAVVLPTDTVYGLCADAYHSGPARRLFHLKGRPETQPLALLASDVDLLLECLPEFRGESARIVRALLPGPLTLVLANPARRFRWLTGERPDTIGVRVPDLPAAARGVVAEMGCVVATSANRHGGPEPRRLEQVPEAIRRGCGALVDGGELPGTPSTVIDFTGRTPRALREGAVPSSEALDRLGAAVRSR